MQQKFMLSFYHAATVGSSYQFQVCINLPHWQLSQVLISDEHRVVLCQHKLKHLITSVGPGSSKLLKKSCSGYRGGASEGPEPHSSFHASNMPLRLDPGKGDTWIWPSQFWAVILKAHWCAITLLRDNSKSTGIWKMGGKKYRDFLSALLPGLRTTHLLTAGKPTRQCGIKLCLRLPMTHPLGDSLAKAQDQPPPACHPFSPLSRHYRCFPPVMEGLKRCNTLDPCTSTEEPFMGTKWMQQTMDTPSTDK